MTSTPKPSQYAVIATGGAQHLVSAGQVLQLPLMDVKPGETVTFDQVLLTIKDQAVVVGAPVVAGATVTAKVIDHGKTAKVRGVKFHNKVRYRRTFGHRQDYTKVKIEKVG